MTGTKKAVLGGVTVLVGLVHAYKIYKSGKWHMSMILLLHDNNWKLASGRDVDTKSR